MTALPGHQDPPLQHGENILAMLPPRETDNLEEVTPDPPVNIPPAKQDHLLSISNCPLVATTPAQAITSDGFVEHQLYQISWLAVSALKK